MQRFGKPVTSRCRARSSMRALIAVPRQRNTQDEKKAIKDGCIPDDWKDKPAKLRQKDRDARWTVKYTKAKPREDGSTSPVDLAIPVFGYQNHISLAGRSSAVIK